MNKQPNIVFILADQLRACSLPNYGFKEIPIPNFDRLGKEGITFTNAISTYPLCTPYRGMLLTGRHPQTTGVFVNYTCTRYDEIGMGDAFKSAGYSTGYIGKWHLHRGAFPSKDQCWIPEGRSRLGFDYWRAYNCHTRYFNGHVNKDDWNTEAWEGYETEGLLNYFKEFVEKSKDEPFFCVLSPHQPHHAGGKHAPDKYYQKLPEYIELPDNVPESVKKSIQSDYHEYMAMVLALDDMMGNILHYLGEKNMLDNTILVFTSDHGTQMGAHIELPTEGNNAWAKRRPYEESINVPLFIRLPDNKNVGMKNDTLVAPVDIFPTLCGLAGIPIPRTIEGFDLSGNVTGMNEALEQESLYLMNFSNFDYSPDWIRDDGNEWRGIRTKEYTYVKWRNGKKELYDLKADPLQMENLADKESIHILQSKLEDTLQEFMRLHHDGLHPYIYYRDWIDHERRIIRNAYGKLAHPETEPDWSLME